MTRAQPPAILRAASPAGRDAIALNRRNSLNPHPARLVAPAPEGPSRWLLDSAHHRAVVDGLRALGIILVIAFHGAFVFAKILPREKFDAFVASMPDVLNIVWQALGSEVLFFASGFLLGYLLLREHVRYGSIDARDFWLRRFSRIVPLFLIALAVFLIGRRLHWDRLATNLLFSARIDGYFGITANGGKNYIPVGWSLEVMVHAYLLLPFVVRGVLRTRWPLLTALALAVASIVPRYFALAANPEAYTLPAHRILDAGAVPEVHRDLYYLTWFRLTPFLLGLAAAVVVTHHRRRLEDFCASGLRSAALLGLGLALVGVSGFQSLQRQDGLVYRWLGPEEWLWFWSCQRAVLTLGVAMALLAVLGGRSGAAAWCGRFLALRWFAPVSHGIYSIYLFHFACLIPAALLVFLPAVVEGVRSSPGWGRHELRDHIYAAIDRATVWHYLVIVVLTVWWSTRLAALLTRYVEAPVQGWLRARRSPNRRPLLPEAAADERRGPAVGRELP